MPITAATPSSNWPSATSRRTVGPLPIRQLRSQLGLGRHRHAGPQPPALDHQYRRDPHRPDRHQNHPTPLRLAPRTDHPFRPTTTVTPAHPMALAETMANSPRKHPGPPATDLNRRRHRRHHPEPGENNQTPRSATPDPSRPDSHHTTPDPSQTAQIIHSIPTRWIEA
jgi:hypothetical protein